VPQNFPATISWDGLNVILSYLDYANQIKVQTFKVSENDPNSMESTITTNNCRQVAEILRKVGNFMPANSSMSLITADKSSGAAYTRRRCLH